MKCKAVFDKIDELNDRYVDFWQEVCEIESKSSDKEGVDAVGRYFIDHVKEFGWKVDIFPQKVSGDAVCITMNPCASKEPVVFSGHIDTVHPRGLFGYPAVKRDVKKMYGPGVTDCKGGVVSSLLAMVALEKCGYRERPVKLVLQSDEEVSSLTSGKATVEFMAECAKGCAAFLNCEPHTTGEIVIRRKGIIRFILEITGKSVHSSICYEGINAIHEAAYKIIEIEKFKDKDGITANCGVIEGGTVANTVPEKCIITVDVRFADSEQLEYIKNEIQKIADTSYIEGTSCELRVKSFRVSMDKSEANDRLLERISEIFDRNGLEHVEACSSNGGADASDMTSRGITTVDCLGVRGGMIHSKDEYAYIASLAESAKMLAAIAIEI